MFLGLDILVCCGFEFFRYMDGGGYYVIFRIMLRVFLNIRGLDFIVKRMKVKRNRMINISE